MEDEPLDDAEVTLGRREVQRRRPVAVARRHRQRTLQDLYKESKSVPENLLSSGGKFKT